MIYDYTKSIYIHNRFRGLLDRKVYMSNSFFVSFEKLGKFLSFLIVFVFIICILFIPIINANSLNTNFTNEGYSFIMSEEEYIWPIPGYTSITSPFGKRYSPTAGASSYHKGIDIGAPKGTQLFAITSGKITFTGFLGGGGYTITLTNGDMKFTYCHVSPYYIVQKGDNIQKGQLIRLCRTQKCLWCQR